MSMIIFLIPPSEGKNTGGKLGVEGTYFSFIKPKIIAENATEKDLKCKGKRYQEGIELNKNIFTGKTLILPSIDRYSGVMYSAIDYSGMNQNGKEFFEQNFLILSGMYGLLKTSDEIGNYKLPIETKGLYDFWGDQILESINNLDPDYVVNLLPISYGKLIYGKNKSIASVFNKKRKFMIININFLRSDGSKLTHGVKKIKGEWIKSICENNVEDYKEFGGEIFTREDDIIDINITIT